LNPDGEGKEFGKANAEGGQQKAHDVLIAFKADAHQGIEESEEASDRESHGQTK
jgi:hypothetical protein